MLRRLVIENYGLIARADIAFAAGATMFTGETGSGKTMVLGALMFALGERAGVDAVRAGSARAAVMLEFDPVNPLRERLDADGFGVDCDEACTIAREISVESGKSAVRLNGRPATAGYVRSIAAEVADFAGQHEAQRLLSPAYHALLLDRFAGAPAADARARVIAAFDRCKAIGDDLQLLASSVRGAQEREAYARFALQEIEAASPAPDEDDRLAARVRVLRNAEKIALALRSAHDGLSREATGASDAAGAVCAALAQIAQFDDAFAEMAAAAQALQSESEDLGLRIARAIDAMEYDAGELEASEARLDALENLKRKYGGSLEAVLACASQFHEQVDLANDSGERKRRLERDYEAAQSALRQAAEELSALRESAARRLRTAMQSELKTLALTSARFDVAFERIEPIGREGAESAQFFFSANKGQPERPLARIASGGELSRVLLALVVVLAGARDGTALVFDEIDAGVGGATAAAVGTRIGNLAARTQTICVTHLAQIASWADAHYVLEKNENGKTTAITVRALRTDAERTAELARMLSGEARDEALAHARMLLAQTHDRQAAV